MKLKFTLIALVAMLSSFAVNAANSQQVDVVLPTGVSESTFGANTVTDGTNYYATLQAAVEAVAGQANAVLYCKPDAELGNMQHAPVVSTLTIYGNGASVTGFEHFDLGNTDKNENSGLAITGDMTLTIKNLDGFSVWGAKSTAHGVNVVIEECEDMGKVFITGTTGILNIAIEDSEFKGREKEAVYSNADGAITLTNVAFSNLNKAINLNHKAAGTQTVTISGCSFTNCGADVAADQIPVRVLTSVEGGKSVLNVSNTTFTGTPEGGADILLDYGVGVTEATVSNTAANVLPENKDGNAEMVSVTANQGYTNVAPAYVATVGEQGYATLTEAFAAVTDDAQTVVVLQDVTEELTGAYLRGNITTENDAKVTITLTNSGQNYYIYCPYTFVLGKNVTLNVPNGCLFYYAGGTIINGKVVTNGYYQRYAGTKLTINEPGSMTVTSETCIIRLTDGDANAGIYVVGDNNDETVGLKLSVAYFYQGMINAKDANLQVGTYWQTNDTDGQGSANLVLDNSTLTVSVYDHPAKATGNSTVTLKNGSVINAKNGGFTYGDAATFSVDATSKIIGKNGVDVELPVAKIGTKMYRTLQDAINAVMNGETITLIGDITENVTVTEKTGLYYTIDGNDKKMNGTITVTSLSDTNDNRRITIKNINFVTTEGRDFITSTATNHYPRLTVEGCSFTGTGKEAANTVAIRLKSSHSVVIKECTGTGLHSFLQNTAGWNLTIENVTVTESKSAFALGTVQDVTVKGCTADVEGYGIRMDAQYDNNAVLENNTVKAFIPVVVRKASVDSNVTVNGENTMNATNTDGIWFAIGTSEYEANGTMPTAATGNVVVALNDAALDSKGIYGNALAGQGTAEAPYLINNIADLNIFRDKVNSGDTKYSAPGVYVALGADIDMTGINWVGIGSMTAAHGFMGNFDGAGYTISNLTITNPALDSDGYAYAGLFALTEGTDKNNQNFVKNLTIENVTIKTTGHIAAAAIAYAYYTVVENVKVCGNIAIEGGDYTAGVLAYTRRCVNASNISIIGNENSYVKGAQVVGGVISDIQLNGGLIADYSNFSAEGVTVSGTKMVGGISGIIATQTLNGATVKNVTLSSGDSRVGTIAGAFGGTSTISNVTVENVTGATAIVGATYDGGEPVQILEYNGVYTIKSQFLSGEGTEENPYLISSVEDILFFRNSVNAGETKYNAKGVYVALGANIDLAGINWVGIGSMTAAHGFMGNFDGAGYTISNLTITNPALDSDGYAYAGLFALTEGTDKNNQNFVKNLTIENVTIKTTGHIAAAAIAYAYYTVVENVKVCGNIAIEGGDYTAGVLAYTRRCVNASNISIIGNENSYVKGAQVVGGVISDIQLNGGLIADYSNFSAEGVTVSGTKMVGGISGIIATQTLNGATVKNVTLSSGDSRVGTIAGAFGGTSTISNVTVENVTGATAIVGATYDGGEPVQILEYNGVYTIKSQFLSGEGTEENPYLISSVEDILFFRNSVNAGETQYNAEGVYVALGANIDLAGIDWSVNIGDDCNATFDGIFDGKNFTISNLTATETAKKGDGYICTGLFGAIYGNAVVKNLTIENVTINAPFVGNNVAAVVGFGYTAKGSIENVKVIGDININAPLATGVGAIVGYGYSSSLAIENCQVIGNVGSSIVAKSYAGAVIGYSTSKGINANTVENVSITATGSVGAVAGIMLAGGSAADNTVKNVTLSATGELWANSAAVVAGTITDGSVTVSNTTVENVTANGAEASIVGGILVEKPTTAIAKVEARIGDVYYTTLAKAIAAALAGETIVLIADAEVVADETITLNGVNLSTLEGVTLTNNGTIEVKGEVSLNIATLAGSSIDLCEGAIINNSKVNGAAYVAGNVLFRGENTFTMITDYGDYYSEETPSKWTVEAGASLTLTKNDRYGLGYGDVVAVYGNIENALEARENLTDADASINMYGGLVGMTNSASPDANNKFTAENAYLIFGVQGDKSFGNKPGNYYSNYAIDFTNCVVTANGFKFYEDKGTSTVNFKNSDLLVNGVLMTNDANSAFNFENCVVLSKATSNGSDDKNQNAGVMTLVNTSFTYNAKFTNVGTINLDLKSVLAAPSIAGDGTIKVDATGVMEEVVVIAGDMSAFTGTIEVVDGDYKITDAGLVVYNASYISEYTIDDTNSVDFTNDAEKTVGTLTYKRTLIEGIWNALYLPFEISVEELVENYDIAYYNQMHSYDSDNNGSFDSYEMEVAYITSGRLRANYPYFIRPKSADDCELEYVANDVILYPAVEKKIQTSSVANIFTLSGTHKAMGKEDLNGCYAISVDGDWSATSGLKAHRLYLKIEENDNSPFATTRAKSIRIVVAGEGTTGIDEMTEQRAESKEIYDLSGRRVLEAEKGGIYIVNGVKTLVK